MSVMTVSIGSTMLVASSRLPAPLQEWRSPPCVRRKLEETQARSATRRSWARAAARRSQPAAARLVDQEVEPRKLLFRNVDQLRNLSKRASSGVPAPAFAGFRKRIRSVAREDAASIQRCAQPARRADARQRRPGAPFAVGSRDQNRRKLVLRIAQRSRQNSHLRQVELPPRGRGGKLLPRPCRCSTAAT